MPDAMKLGDKVLLIGDKNFLVTLSRDDFHTQFGIIELKKLAGKKFGAKIKTKQGYGFVAVRPNVTDFLTKRLKRLPQIISLKDCAFIAGHTGLSPGYKVLDAGTGSGFLAIFMANLVKPDGFVHTYEIKKEFFEVAKKNIEDSGLSKWVAIKNSDVSNAREKDLDLVALDLVGAENVVPKAAKMLKKGGFIVVYSPYIEQVKLAVLALHSSGFANVKTFEVLTRKYKVGEFTRPETQMLGHTGYITFGRLV